MPTEASAILALPYIQPSQAQKHVTHNEALRMLDVLVQLTVSSRSQTTPPLAPEAGERHIVAAAASGGFAGQAGHIALYEQGNWVFFAAQPGWSAQVLDEGVNVIFESGVWRAPAERDHRFASVGVNAEADTVNRLAVAAEATLLTHDGAGHQLKVNKAAATDTASLLFQSGWNGRAEMGLAGSDDFEIKTSADGSVFQTALQAEAASGRISVPQGLRIAPGTAAVPGLGFTTDPDTGVYGPAADQIAIAVGGAQKLLISSTEMALDIPITGTATTQSVTDTTTGRLLKVGAHGLGVGQVNNEGDLNQIQPGFWTSKMGTDLTNAPTVIASSERGFVYSHRSPGCNFQMLASRSNGRMAFRTGTNSLVDGQGWRELIHTANMVGAVSQSGGVPTGAVIERGSNANGHYTRWADGTQICWVRDVNFGSIIAAGVGTYADPYRTNTATNLTWPAAFSQAPCTASEVYLSDVAVAPAARMLQLDVSQAPTATGWANLRVSRSSGSSTPGNALVSVVATGRWN